MTKKYAIYFATLVLSAVLHRTWSQSQQHVWFLKDQNIDFTQGSTPVISPIQNQFVPPLTIKFVTVSQAQRPLKMVIL